VIDGGNIRIPKGDSIGIKQGTPFKLRNGLTEPARVLVVKAKERV
jgi:mannose-6-phosphate isomerase-like protein (cupin superfamily)